MQQGVQRAACRIEYRRIDLKLMFFAEHLRYLPGIIDGSGQRRHFLVSIDADDKGMVVREMQCLLVIIGRNTILIACHRLLLTIDSRIFVHKSIE